MDSTRSIENSCWIYWNLLKLDSMNYPLIGSTIFRLRLRLDGGMLIDVYDYSTNFYLTSIDEEDNGFRCLVIEISSFLGSNVSE